MKRKKTLIITSTIIILVLLMAIGVLSRRGIKPEIVKTSTITKGNLKAYLSTTAVIQSRKGKDYMGSSQLTVKHIFVKVGEHVKKGQTLLEYDISDLTASVEQSKLQYSNALLQKNELVEQKKKLDKSIADLDKQIQLMESNHDPAYNTQLQTLKNQRDSIQPISNEKIKLMSNSVALAKLSLDSSSSKLNKYRKGIVSDFYGTVTELNALEGSASNLSKPAVVIQQLDNLMAVVSLGKYDALKVKVGQETLLKYGDMDFKGKVAFINPAAVSSISTSGQSTSLEGEINILDENSSLKVDFDVSVDILLGSATDVVKIPIECIKYDKDDKSYVFKVVENKVKQVEVSLGLQSDIEAEVLKGLTLSDIVVLNPSITIVDGSIVKVSKE